MMGKLAIGFTYISSLLFAYVLVLLRYLNEYCKDKSCVEKVGYIYSNIINYEYNFMTIMCMCLIFMVVLSFVGIFTIKRYNANTVINFRMNKDEYNNTVVYWFSYIIPIFSFSVDFTGLFFLVLTFFLGLYIFIRSKCIQTSPIFMLLGYSIYSNYDGIYVITKYTLEEYNTKIRLNEEPLLARELVPNVFFIP